MMLPVPMVEERVELVVANGTELEPELPYMEDEAPPETLDSGPVRKGPRLLEAPEPVESGTEVGDVPKIPPELDDELVGYRGKAELDGIDAPEEYPGEVPDGVMKVDFVFEW